ncbi:MAG: hypothetical protein F6K63_08250 [Moorea sp. SIO1G6]|uniref:hypothetical protein n=1 Tax=Moorena sp. SIO1G6 TaxID=2607840 RepID=UPI0013C29C7C|nr:hypothetical protein [Moorena sp. SIO1G6]NET64376.1 hypothetical protein [Moorena sp. SIO1G6]
MSDCRGFPHSLLHQEAQEFDGCISFLLFDTVVRYGAGPPNPGYEAENEAPLTHPTQLFYKNEMHPV